MDDGASLVPPASENLPAPAPGQQRASNKRPPPQPTPPSQELWQSMVDKDLLILRLQEEVRDLRQEKEVFHTLQGGLQEEVRDLKQEKEVWQAKKRRLLEELA